MRKSVDAVKVNIYKTIQQQPSLTFIETEEFVPLSKQSLAKPHIVMPRKCQACTFNSEKIETLLKMCHKQELQLEERTVNEHNLQNELAN